MALFDPTYRQSLSRRGFLKASLLGAGMVALYSGEVERHWIDVVRREITLRGLSSAFNGFRIVQLSDIHMDEYTEPFFLRNVVNQINRLQPDAVFLTGDFVSYGPITRHFAAGAAWQCANILNELHCDKRYAVLGNHDVIVGAKQVAAALTSNGITVLDNACLPIERASNRFWLTGVDDPLEGHPDTESAIPASIRGLPDEPVVLLCHTPDYADQLLADPVGNAIGLMLSGHTHGGQIRLPLMRAVHLPELGRKYIEGRFELGSMQLYVNRGIGTVGLPFRFNCPPEITLLTLHAV
jgi:hypothetical protein